MPSLNPHADVAARAQVEKTPKLRRVLGRLDLIGIGINQIIGGAIFLVPATLAAQIGGWSPLAYILAGGASLLIALCFAEAASRFTSTGGAYLYTRAAFGSFIGFEIGWLQWFVRVSSQAGIVNGLVLALSAFWPLARDEAYRALIVVSITLGVGYLHVRGIRLSAAAINTLAIGKLAPLLIFITAGLYWADWTRFGPLPAITGVQAGSAALMLMFAFGGFESITIPAGESKTPTRDVPYALIASIIAVIVIMTLTQVVAMATLPNLTSSRTPVADAAGTFLGPLGATMIGLGSILSMFGNNVGGSLAASRILFALAENEEVPAFFARIHRIYRTPVVAIWFSTAVAVVLALTGSFVTLVIVSTVARLVTYVGVSAATLSLRRIGPAEYTIPFGPAIPVAASVISIATLAGATWQQLTGGFLALAAGALLFSVHRLFQSRSAR